MFERCCLCDGPAQYSGQSMTFLCVCERCGNYFITNVAMGQGVIQEKIGDKRFLLSAATREAYLRALATRDDRLLITLNSTNMEQIATGMTEKSSPIAAAEHFLIHMSQNQRGFYQFQDFSPENDYPLAVCRNRLDFMVVINYLLRISLIVDSNGRNRILETDSNSISIRLSTDGFERISELNKTKHKTIAFAAMFFHPRLNDAFENGIKKAVEETTNLKCIRADRVEHNDDINDWVLGQIRQSAFLISDYTGNRGGVYYEAGFAMGLAIPVIYTCMNKRKYINRLHFDTNHRNHIFWDTTDILYSRLRDRIKATIPMEYLK
jgi:hypothetical protein